MAWHLGARIADLPVGEIALGLRTGPQRKGPGPREMLRLGTVVPSEDPAGQLPSHRASDTSTPLSPPAALASPDANISAMPCDATSSPSLSLLSSCAGIHPMQIATHTLSYIEIANIRNVPDMDSISFFADILSLTCEFEKRIDGTLQLEVFTTGKAAPSHVQKAKISKCATLLCPSSKSPSDS